MKEIRQGVMIPLGHGKWVKSDVIIAVEPLDNSIVYQTDRDGNRLRSRVLINHAEEEIIANRTAESILKSMTKQDDDLNQFGKAIKNLRKEFPDGIVPDNEMSEIDHVMAALIHCSTMTDAIEYSPYGRSKFYALVKKHGIDTKPYLESTEIQKHIMIHKDDGLI
jgi:hypothetical protein